MNEKRWRSFRKGLTAFLALFAFQFVSGFANSAIGLLLPTDAHLKGVSESEIGLISGAFDFTSFVAGFAIPPILSEFNMNHFFLTGLVLFSISNAAFGCMTYFEVQWIYVTWSFLLRCIQGLGYAMSWFALIPILFKLYPFNKGQMSGLTETFFEIGAILGPVFAAFMYHVTIYVAPYIITSLFGLFLALLCLLFMEPFAGDDETASDPNDETIPLSESFDENIPPPKNISDRFLTMCKVFLSSDVILSSIPFLVSSASNGLIGVYLSPLITRFMAIPDEDAGLYFMPLAAASIVFSPLWGYLVDWKFKWLSYMFGPVMGLLACFLLLLVVFFDGIQYNREVPYCSFSPN